jgi:hypothetical protein
MAPALTISTEAVLYLIDKSLDSMIAIAEALGDELVNEHPKLEGANSAFGIVTHCVGGGRWWAGHVVEGNEVDRDWGNEFGAVGTVEELVLKIETLRQALSHAVSNADGLAAPLGIAPDFFAGTPVAATQGGALLRFYGELAQHVGQMEISRDILLGKTVA